MFISTLYPDLNLTLQTTEEDVKNYFLNKIQPLLDATVSFAVSNSATFSYLTLEKEDGLFEKIKNNPPQCISYKADYHHSKQFEQTFLYDAIQFMTTNINQKEIEQYLALYQHLFNITKDEIIGYTLYFHYTNITYKYEIGLQTLFSQVNSANIDTSNVVYSTTNTDETYNLSHDEINNHEESDDDLDKRFEFYDKSAEVAKDVEIYLVENQFIQMNTPKAEALNIIRDYCEENHSVKKLAKSSYYQQNVFFDKVYADCITKLHTKKTQELFNQAKISPEIMLAKSYEQRLILAKRLFAEEEIQFIDPEKISDMLLRAKRYYEINFIPQKVKELAESNLSHKAIAEQLGISVAKVKKYLPK